MARNLGVFLLASLLLDLAYYGFPTQGTPFLSWGRFWHSAIVVAALSIYRGLCRPM